MIPTRSVPSGKTPLRSLSDMRFLSLVFLVFVGCAAKPPGGGGDDGPSGDDEPPIDACPCPGDGGGGGDGGGPSPGCEGDGSSAAQPFGNHGAAYAAGTILPDHLSQAALDQAVRNYYDGWKADFLIAGCGTGRYYVATGHDNNMTVSEAHGFGMVIVAYMAGHDAEAKQIFDGMFHYYEDHPSKITPSLMAWSQDSSCSNNEGANSATDGDLDIAYALLLADKQWSSGGDINYRAEAEELLDGIRDGDVDDSGRYILLGDWVSGAHYDSTRSSDFMPGHLASFAAVTGDGVWNDIADTTYQIVDDLQTGDAPETGLLPDFILDPLGDPEPAYSGFLEGPRDGAYAYNACRDPWRIAIDFLNNGDSRARTAVGRMTDWIRAETNGDPYAILPGYSLSGQQVGGDYFDLAFVAPFGVAAMVDADNQAWLNSLWDATVGNDGGYYGKTIAMLSLIAMSGNWWAPEAAPCPE